MAESAPSTRSYLTFLLALSLLGALGLLVQQSNVTAMATATYCGDGGIQSPNSNGRYETCDGSNFGDKICKSFGYSSGSLKCDMDSNTNPCQIDTSGCSGSGGTSASSSGSPSCGNGIIETGEECDGSNFGGKGCGSYGYAGGNLVCVTDSTGKECQIGTRFCTTSSSSSSSSNSSSSTPSQPSSSTSGTCGNGVIDSGEECDGSNFAGKECKTFGYACGNLYCDPNPDDRGRRCQILVIQGGGTCSNSCGGSSPSAAYCGDGSCNGGETCSSCSSDCGSCVQTRTSPTLSISPSFFGLTAQGGSNPLPTFLTITNFGGDLLSWSVSDNADWLTVRRSLAGGETSGVESAGASSTPPLSVSVNAAGLSAGTHTATITIISNGGNANIPVTLTIPSTSTASPVLSVSAYSMSFGATLGDSISAELSITNAGSGYLTWSISDNAGWLTVRRNLAGGDTSGTEGPGARSTPPLTTTANSTGLNAGIYTATITVSSNGGNANIPVTLTVTTLSESAQPAAPSNLEITDSAYLTYVTLQWRHVNPTACDYNIYRSRNDSVFTKIAKTSNLIFTDRTSFSPGNYSYYVTCITAAESKPSGTAVITFSASLQAPAAPNRTQADSAQRAKPAVDPNLVLSCIVSYQSEGRGCFKILKDGVEQFTSCESYLSQKASTGTWDMQLDYALPGYEFESVSPAGPQVCDGKNVTKVYWYWYLPETSKKCKVSIESNIGSVCYTFLLDGKPFNSSCAAYGYRTILGPKGLWDLQVSPVAGFDYPPKITPAGTQTCTNSNTDINWDIKFNSSTPLGSCKDRCDKYDASATCQCDVKCGEFKDCCKDYDNYCKADASKVCNANVESNINSCWDLLVDGKNYASNICGSGLIGISGPAGEWDMRIQPVAGYSFPPDIKPAGSQKCDGQTIRNVYWNVKFTSSSAARPETETAQKSVATPTSGATKCLPTDRFCDSNGVVQRYANCQPKFVEQCPNGCSDGKCVSATPCDIRIESNVVACWKLLFNNSVTLEQCTSGYNVTAKYAGPWDLRVLKVDGYLFPPNITPSGAQSCGDSGAIKWSIFFTPEKTDPLSSFFRSVASFIFGK